MIFDGNECGKNELEKKISIVAGRKFGLISSLRRSLKFNDEPKLAQYIAEPKKGGEVSSGTALDEKRARTKAVCEVIERICLSTINKSKIVSATYNNLKCALDPLSVVGVAGEEKRRFPTYNRSTKFTWVKGFSTTRNKNIWIPAQLVYVPYWKNEPMVRSPITTGAASGTSYSAAIYRGLCEAIERDAFMITYLNKLPRRRIDISSAKSGDIKRLDEIFRRYNLERHSFDISTDIRIPVILTILVDKSGVGPSVSLGMKCGFDVEEALLGSMEEAQQTRPWIREEMQKFIETKRMSPEYRYFLERAFYWYDVGMIKKLDFLLKTTDKTSVKRIKSRKFRDSNVRLRAILRVLRALRGREVDMVDVTTGKIRKVGFRVVKMIVPELQPLYLLEGQRYWGGRRLYELPRILGYRKNNSRYSDLNKVPHPFL